MKDFSRQAALYAEFRPDYPANLFQFLAEVTPRHERAWDCATGNGQAALPLAEIFDFVVATDSSLKQLEHARPHARVSYAGSRAEEAPFPDESIDLITVAQAMHWLDPEKFFREAKRILRPDGVVAFWGYGFQQIQDPVLDDILVRFNADVLKGYWPKGREILDNGFKDVSFPFREIDTPPIELSRDWTLNELLGYVRSWSAVNRYLARNSSDPVTKLEADLAQSWPPGSRQQIAWPVFFRAGQMV